MTGEAGNDSYAVDDVGDTVVEHPSGGSDTVYAGVSYKLTANVENLQLIGSGSISGTGNALNNILISNGAGNILAGGAGIDSYVVHSSADQVKEKAGEGNGDTVYAYVSFALANHVENLQLVGSGNINGTGNGGDNALTGNAAANVLDGRGWCGSAWPAAAATTAMWSIMQETSS